NSTGFQRRAIHEDRIELNVPVSIEMRSHTRVEYRLILELDNRVLTRIQRRTAFFKNAPAPVESALHSILTDCFEFGRDVPRAAVDHKGDTVHEKSIDGRQGQGISKSDDSCTSNPKSET